MYHTKNSLIFWLVYATAHSLSLERHSYSRSCEIFLLNYGLAQSTKIQHSAVQNTYWKTRSSLALQAIQHHVTFIIIGNYLIIKITAYMNIFRQFPITSKVKDVSTILPFKKKRENNNHQKDKNEKQTKEVIPSVFSIDEVTHVILQSKTSKFTTWNCLNQTNVVTCGSGIGLGFVCA